MNKSGSPQEAHHFFSTPKSANASESGSQCIILLFAYAYASLPATTCTFIRTPHRLLSLLQHPSAACHHFALSSEIPVSFTLFLLLSLSVSLFEAPSLPTFVVVVHRATHTHTQRSTALRISIICKVFAFVHSIPVQQLFEEVIHHVVSTTVDKTSGQH